MSDSVNGCIFIRVVTEDGCTVAQPYEGESVVLVNV